jgi:hypothetical protein
MKTIALRTMVAFGQGLLGGIETHHRSRGWPQRLDVARLGTLRRAAIIRIRRGATDEHGDASAAAELIRYGYRSDPDTSRTSYLWLPIRFDGDYPSIEWHEEWRIEDYANYLTG